jgi:glycosyltransferase involved in cell wall biosynthesis
MRIGYFTNTYLPIIYGSTNSVEYFRKGLELLGHEVFVFAPTFKGFVDTNEKVNRYPSIPWKYKIDYPIALSIWPSMRSRIGKLNLDVIHCHQPFSIGQEGLRQARKNNCPVVFTHHCRYEDYVHYIPLGLAASMLRRYVKKKATWFANQCDQVIAPSQTIKTLIQERGVNKPIEVLPTGINWDKFQAADRQKIRKKYGIKEEDILLLNIGRMEEEKNIQFLFDIALEILKEERNVKLMMVGDGSIKDSLSRRSIQAGLAKNVFFPGLIPQDEIADYYSAGDIFLHTSKSETQGMTINEAMSVGVPTVAIEATGAIDMIENGVNGILTDDSKNEFKKMVEKLIKNRILRVELGSAAREKSKKYDFKNQARRLEEIYIDLIDHKKDHL